MTDDTTTTQLEQDAPALESAVIDATFDLTEDGDGDDAEVDRPWLRPGKWYVVHSQSGYEKKVDANLKAVTGHLRNHCNGLCAEYECGCERYLQDFAGCCAVA